MFPHPTSEDDRKLTPPARSSTPSSTSSRADVPGGCCPETFRPGRGVYLWFGRWRIDGTWERLRWAIQERLRTRLGRNPHPSASPVVSQSVKTTGVGGGARGDEGAKKVKGRKRHLLLVERKSSTYPTRCSKQLRKGFLGSWSIPSSANFGRMGF
jgi:transposase